MARGIKIKGTVKRLDYKSTQLLFKTINTQESELQKKLSKLLSESRDVKRAIMAIRKTKIILLKVEL